jgi:hypothetical protein
MDRFKLRAFAVLSSAVKDEKNLDHSAGKQKAKYTLLVGD